MNTRSTMLNVFVLCSILQHLSRTEQKIIVCSDSYNISLTGNLYFLYLIDIFYRWCFDHGDLTYQNWDKISCKCLCSKLLNSNKQGFNISSWAYFFLFNLKLPKFCYWILISNQILFFREIFQYIFKKFTFKYTEYALVV